MTNDIQNASIFKSGSVLRIYPGFRVSACDLELKELSSISKKYTSKGGGIRLARTMLVTIKEAVLAEMHEKLGTEALLYLLPVDLRDCKKFSEELESGSYKGLSMEIASAKILDQDVPIRKGTASETILKKVRSAISKLDDMRTRYNDELTTRCLERLSNHFELREDEYETLMVDMIDRNAKHFDKASNGKASDLQIKIEGLKAQLEEAHKQLQELRNGQVINFVNGDGKINEHKVRGEVLEKISEKAKASEFFDRPFSPFTFG